MLLKRNDFAVACEVSVTTKPEHEFQNIKKCLAEPVDRVALVSTSVKQLQAVRELTLALPEAEQQKLLFVSPQELMDFLDQKDAAEASELTTNRGYKVSVRRFSATQAEQEQHRDQIAGSLARSMTKKVEKA